MEDKVETVAQEAFEKWYGGEAAQLPTWNPLYDFIGDTADTPEAEAFTESQREAFRAGFIAAFARK